MIAKTIMKTQCKIIFNYSILRIEMFCRFLIIILAVIAEFILSLNREGCFHYIRISIYFVVGVAVSLDILYTVKYT